MHMVCSEVSIETCMVKETSLFCKADLCGMQFSIEGVSVFLNAITVTVGATDFRSLVAQIEPSPSLNPKPETVQFVQLDF